MQEVELTPKLLLEFSLAYAKIPTVTFSGGDGMPFEVLPLCAWFQEMQDTECKGAHNGYMAIFQAYLAGREIFVLPDLGGQEFLTFLATTIKSKMVGGRYGA